MRPLVDADVLVKHVKCVSSLQSLRWREVLFLDANLKAERNHLKLIKSGQRNVKNFSEIYKYVCLLKMKTVTSAASAWSLSWPSKSPPHFLPAAHLEQIEHSVLGRRRSLQGGLRRKIPMYLAVFNIEVTTYPMNTQVWRQLYVQIVTKFQGGKLQPCKMGFSGWSCRVSFIKSPVPLG